MESNYLLALAACETFGPRRLKLLLEYYKNPSKIWTAKESDLITLGLKKNISLSFIRHRKEFDIGKYLKSLGRLQINYTTILDKDYPQRLREISDPPMVLYYKGKLPGNKALKTVAVVGTRKMTPYGKEVTRMFTKELAKKGVVIVSGLAFGVDVEAHSSCMSVAGQTLAVLASGLEKITPVSNASVGERIIKKGGALISEYPVGHKVTKSDFAIRNRIISGLSDVVLVIEGERKSGTLLTASRAAEQGRTVYAVPGQITSSMSGAPHFLIQNGAQIGLDPKDILHELNIAS